MNFRFGRFFSLVINFSLGTFFLILGVVTLFIPWLTSWQNSIIDLILHQKLILSLFGISFCLIGLSAFIYAFFSNKHQFISLPMGQHLVTIDEQVIEHYLKTYFQKQFPKQTIPFSLTLKKQLILVQAHFPFLPRDEQKLFMENTQKHLSHLFNELTGSLHTINLTASFESANLKTV